MDNLNYIEKLFSCPLCGFTNNQPIFWEEIAIKGEHYSLGINECKSCQTCYTNPRLNIDGLSVLYDEGYMEHTVSGSYHVEAEVSELEYLQFVKYLNKELPTGGNVLDVGCGVGLMLNAISENCPNVKVEGVEFSRFAAQKAIEKGHRVNLGDITKIKTLPINGFDAIILLYVLEHVPDPIGILNRCHSLLKKGGKLLVAVPNYRYLKLTHTGIMSRVIYRKPSNLHVGEHLFNYTPSTIDKFLKKCNFLPNYYGQAKPLKTGTKIQRFLKSNFANIFDLLFFLGYHIGGIHIISTKN